VIGFRAVEEMPGGVARGLVHPAFMTIVEVDPGAEFDDLAAIQVIEAEHPIGAAFVLRHGFSEFNADQRVGAFLSEPSPRTIFVIGQVVVAEKEDEYNYWFDVDDRKAPAGQPRVSHYHERLAYPGFIRATRLKRIRSRAQADLENNQPNYVTLYEVDSPRALQSDEYVAASKRPSDGLGLFSLVIRRTYLEIDG